MCAYAQTVLLEQRRNLAGRGVTRGKNTHPHRKKPLLSGRCTEYFGHSLFLWPDGCARSRSRSHGMTSSRPPSLPLPRISELCFPALPLTPDSRGFPIRQPVGCSWFRQARHSLSISPLSVTANRNNRPTTNPLMPHVERGPRRAQRDCLSSSVVALVIRATRAKLLSLLGQMQSGRARFRGLMVLARHFVSPSISTALFFALLCFPDCPRTSLV